MFSILIDKLKRIILFDKKYMILAKKSSNSLTHYVALATDRMG